jgi:hypothetical protein
MTWKLWWAVMYDMVLIDDVANLKEKLPFLFLLNIKN